MTQAAGSPAPERIARPGRTPRSTYRLQITPTFTLDDAAGWVDYLHCLGVDWVYCSPLLQAEHGSIHGYDVIDHSRTDAARGGRDGLARLADTAHTLAMGLLVDIVPNHVGVATATASVWWRDVLVHGRESAHADAFDIDWDAGGGKLLLPVLGEDTDELAALTLRGGVAINEANDAEVDDARLCYHDRAFPIAAGSRHAGDTPQNVHAHQHYCLIDARRATTDLNYRRFFAVNSLAAIRVEDPEVFAASHGEIQHWIEAGWVDGLRVDHPDGLADPAEYLRALQHLSRGIYTVVEKILQPDEELPFAWHCAGTTGYDTLAAVDRVLTDPGGQLLLEKLDSELRGRATTWGEIRQHGKHAVATGILNADVRRLARVAKDVAPFNQLVVAIEALLSCFPVYRTYSADRANYLAQAANTASQQRPDLGSVIAALHSLALLDPGEFGVRFEQTSAAITAKGVEDRAFYRYPRLTSLTEVGGAPDHFALTPEAFHAAQQHRLGTWPDGMTTLTTHDTKRSEDVRARISVFAEVAGDVSQAIARWLQHAQFPDKVLGNLLLQTTLGAWPIERPRLHAYAEKAAREAGESTRWIHPDAAFERALHRLVDACYDEPAINTELATLAERLTPAGWSNSLSAKLVQLTLPGVPDVYRGTELWTNSLVDPDNRRPFDALGADGAAALLKRLDAGWLPPIDVSGAAKLLITSRALRARRDQPERFTTYEAVMAHGAAAQHLLAFDRGGAVTLATRLPMGLAVRDGWGDAYVDLGAPRWRDAITGREFGTVDEPDHFGPTCRIKMDEALSRYPVALLLRCE